MSAIVECPVCGTLCRDTGRDIGIVYEAGYSAIYDHKPVSELTELERKVVESVVDHYRARSAAWYTERQHLSEKARLKLSDTYLKTEGEMINAVTALLAARAAQAVAE